MCAECWKHADWKELMESGAGHIISCSTIVLLKFASQLQSRIEVAPSVWYAHTIGLDFRKRLRGWWDAQARCVMRCVMQSNLAHVYAVIPKKDEICCCRRPRNHARRFALLGDT